MFSENGMTLRANVVERRWRWSGRESETRAEGREKRANLHGSSWRKASLPRCVKSISRFVLVASCVGGNRLDCCRCESQQAVHSEIHAQSKSGHNRSVDVSPRVIFQR